MKIGVHFNCQNDGIAASLRALLPDAHIISYHSATGLPEHVQAERAAVLNACDHVLTSHGDARYGMLSMAALTASARRCHVLPEFVFSGYHPDMCYVRVDGQVVASCTGGYHSRIAVAGYLAGLGARETAALYNRLVFARLDYFGAFEEQVALLCGLWARDGIDAAPLLRRWAAAGCFAHSINHPKMIVLLDVARIACACMGLAPRNQDVDPALLPDRLGQGAMHPVFPDIAAALGIAPEGCFSGGHEKGQAVAFTPLHFVSDCFGRYADISPDDLRATPGVPEAMAALDLPLRAPPRRRLGSAMVLMTYHGTLLRQGPLRGEVSHAALSIEHWEAAYLRPDCAHLPARQSAAGIEGADISPGADRRRVVIARDGTFLCADPQGGHAGFTRDAVAEWEHFLPLHDEEVALLHRLTKADWVLEDGQDVVVRQDIAVLAGPVLRFGRWRIDLARHVPAAAADSVRLVLDGLQCRVHEHTPAAPARSLPEPGRTLGLVGAPCFVAPPLMADAAGLDWMRRSAVAALALDGAPQATQALLRREIDPSVVSADGRPGVLGVRFCGKEAESAVGWSEAAVRLHVLSAVAPAGASFLVPQHVSADALQAWRALGFGALAFRWAGAGAATADLLWLDNASVAELPAEALLGCRARIGLPSGTARRLFWQAGVASDLGAMLVGQGFEPVDARSLPVISAVALVSHAGWIVGRTGQVPLVFCRSGCRIIELADEAGFVQDEWVLSAKLGLRHAILPCPSVDGVLVPNGAKLARLLGLMAEMT